VQSVCSRRASWLQLVKRKCADARTTRSLVAIKVDRSTSSQCCASAFSAVSSRFFKTFFWEKVNGCGVILLLLILYNTLVSVTELFAKDLKYDDLLPYLTCRGTSHGHHHQQFWEVWRSSFDDCKETDIYKYRDRDIIQTCYSIVFWQRRCYKPYSRIV